MARHPVHYGARAPATGPGVIVRHPPRAHHQTSVEKTLSLLDHPADDQSDAQMTRFDFRTVLDNSIVERLVKEGFFEKLFGAGIKAEEERKAKIAFK